MGLLKGNNLRFTEDAAIVGDEVITPAEWVADTKSAVVPQAVAPAGMPAAAEESWDLGLESGLGDLFAEAELPVDIPLQEYDEVRDHLLVSANEAAELDAGPFMQDVQQAAGAFMQERLEGTEAAMLEANPEADFGKVMPYLQRQVAMELDLELVGSVSEIRWTHLKRIEEKIVSEVGEVAADIEGRHEPETFVELLTRREEILSAARLEAERLMMEAQTRAAELMAQAEAMQAQTLGELETERERILEELRREARQQGYDEGKAAGEAEAAMYVQEALQKLNEIAIAFPTAVKQNEEKLVALALEIASKVIQEEISLQPEIVQRTVETALRRVSDLEQVTVKVNPLDLDLILPKQDTFKGIIPDVQNFSIEGNHTIQRGGCVIETNSGSINATIAAQISIVEEIFKNIRAEYEDEVLGELS